ncbi:RNA degradosome polyphosphate kinase [Sporolactobacillus terrae]|uniref:Polyphosphate kinase n=1 Tax=Sporolactobacillus terrae TaxID=269673 RepID=A0ABX5Q603_9BACL|nr:RNA degradosome polyphosphate kinase [Sporolactobacillus terrae]QAA22071.1 RNA degradosome polyphosphate kinase [Sporolactobacillus terrae]QAA26958.1 RNA degradosome polyphosphate kinase [Sporolactobacillus terrae]UAK16866.1 RNA degradosome polyphosphate kinase [Sporolactobacillus terrae]
MEQFDRQEYFSNRELSWLLFNERVLEEARDKDNPLLERVKFLSITASNLDEFFMVRVASLIDMVNVGYDKSDPSGMKPEQQLAAISTAAHHMIAQQYTTYNRMLKKLLDEKNIHILDVDELAQKQLDFIDHYFNREVYPVLTPMAVDSSRPFPLILNKSINIAAFIHKKNSQIQHREFVTVQVPNVLPRVVKLPDQEGHTSFILLENIIRRHLHQLFVGFDVIESACYRVIRDMDLEVDEEDTEDLLKEIEKQLRLRERGNVIHLDVEAGISDRLIAKLFDRLSVSQENVYRVNGPIDLTFLSKLVGKIEAPGDMVYSANRPFIQYELLEHSIFDAMRAGDIFLHHPYESFDPVIELIRQASRDPQVLAIKMTLYRVSGHSPIIRYLEKAAENGKQVTVLVELKARFDEENNINWAQKLEKTGCHVIYGLVGLKTHCKMALVVRREENGIKRYMHFGTGNYNDITAHFYTDMGLLTCNEQMGIDASNVFNMLSGYSEPPYFHKLVMAPLWLRDTLMDLIDNEIKNAQDGKPAFIRAKMNALSDEGMIKAMYRASAAGVKIQLIIRGICCLRTGIPGVSENIDVHSIVGRYLEHSRIYMFGNGGDTLVYLASADLMPRNLNRRVELMFPIENAKIKKTIIDLFDLMMRDNIKTRVLGSDNHYEKTDRRGKIPFNVQEYLAKMAAQRTIRREDSLRERRTFIPIKGNEDSQNPDH